MLTDDDIITHVAEKEVQKQKHKAAKEARQVLAAAMKKEKEKVEKEWQEIQDAHLAALGQWEARVKILADEGIPKSKWPKKPKRASKLVNVRGIPVGSRLQPKKYPQVYP